MPAQRFLGGGFGRGAKPPSEFPSEATPTANPRNGAIATALVILNPAAGGGRSARLWPSIREAMSRLRFEHVETRTPGEAARLAAGAVRRAVPLVVAVGGDGTLNEVVNGVTGEDGQSRAAVGVIMTGRGRDAARNLGVPRNPVEAARRMAEGSEIALDLGLARWPGGHRFFVNSLGAGFDAAVAARAARLGGGGSIPYLGAVAQSLRAYRPVDVTVEVDGGRRSSGPAAAVIVSNGPYFGGGMRIAPAADPADGALDLVELGPLGRWELICWLPTLYWGGHVRNRHVRLARARRVRIDTPAPLPLEMDGELCGETPVEVCVCPGGLRLRR